MLVLKRKEGQWVEVTHHSGDKMRIRVCKIRSGRPAQLDLAFDDGPRHFHIERPERSFASTSSDRDRELELDLVDERSSTET